MAAPSVLTTSLLIILLVVSFLATPTSSIGEDVHLLEFKESLKSSSSLDSTWLKGTNPCDRQKPWAGVDCTETNYKTVSALLLMNRGLAGDSADLDVEALGHLMTLRVLSLENNTFSGSMPEFNRLRSLRALFLSVNQFSGEIPSNFFEMMGSLKKIYLSRNKFSGKIPGSIAKLGSLTELMLQQNEFSGPVPSLEQQSLQKIDLSYNRLQGEIPQGMSKFTAQAFEGNGELCGSVVSRECNRQPPPPPPPLPPARKKVFAGSSTKWIILGVVVAVLLMSILFKAKKKDVNFTMLGKGRDQKEPKALENVDESAVQVHVASSNMVASNSTNRRSMSSTRRSGANSYNESGSNSSKRGRGTAKSVNDLVVINEEKGIFGLPDLMKATAEILGSGGLGSAYKATMSSIGLTVVVKRMKDMNKLDRDAFEAEVRKLGRIRHMNILPPLAYHYRKEEKLFVTEFVPKGSLLFLLHGDRSPAHEELNWPTRLKIIKGIARGMGFLHTEFANYALPHGNLKSSNILIASNYEPLLTDYALHSLMSNTQSVQALFAYKCPEAVLYQQLSAKSDVYCLGVVILEIMTGKFPMRYLNNQKGGTDVVQWAKQAVIDDRVAELIDPEIAHTAESLDQMVKMLCVGATCTESDPDQRIEMREAIRSIEEIQV